MIFLKVLLMILLVLWLISLIRIGVRVAYGEAGLFVTELVGPFRIQILPAKPKKEKKNKPPAAEKQEEAHKVDRPGTLPRVMKKLPLIAEFCGALKRKIRIDNLELELIWGGRDPAAIAIGYGQANAVLGMLWPIFEHNFRVKRHSFQIDLDYGRTQPTVEVRAAVTLTVGQAIVLGVRYGIKALRARSKNGKPAGQRQEANV